jgi:hypothetical protein
MSGSSTNQCAWYIQFTSYIQKERRRMKNSQEIMYNNIHNFEIHTLNLIVSISS